MSTCPVGQVRPSQLLWTYGPGATYATPNFSVLTMGLDQWKPEHCAPIEEPRLLAAVKQVLGPQVERLRRPPVVVDEMTNPFSAEGKIGVPVIPFPRWLRCVKCKLLAEYELGLFDIKPNPYRPEKTHFVHSNCDKGKNTDAVPARFLLACRNGHLDDFPWRWFVHRGSDPCKGSLRFYEQGASLQTENLWVQCEGCKKKRSLVHAFGREAANNLPACRGRHPHLNKYEDCSEVPKTILLGATNGWFPVTLSVLAIPLEGDQLSQLILDGWEYFSDAESVDEIRVVVKTLLKSNSLPGIERWDPENIWNAVKDRKVGISVPQTLSEGDIKGPEWDILISEDTPKDSPHFMISKVETPKNYRSSLADVLLLDRLREVNALIGYTRVEAPEVTNNADDRVPMAGLSRNRPDWVPAGEVHGEGIFIRFDEKSVAEWEKVKAVCDRGERLEAGHQGWRNARGLDPGEGYPEIRYIMLHTFAHFLIRELALECGYNAASIRERIYAKKDSESPMAGILIYTAASDSDGTLGGLVELGKPENLGRLLDQALERAKICSSDPLCSDHNPSVDRSLHSAACHACTFVAETSCELGNRYLDRALLVKTLGDSEAAFFG